jgi:hypothetical protein
MTLKEKIENILCNWIDKDYNREFVAKIIESDADDYAIEFAQWIRFNVIEVSQGWQFDGKFYNDEQLLKIFKEERGL